MNHSLLKMSPKSNRPATSIWPVCTTPVCTARSKVLAATALSVLPAAFASIAIGLKLLVNLIGLFAVTASFTELAQARSPQLRLTISQSEMTLEETIQLKVTAVNFSGETPKILNSEAFDLEGGGSSSKFEMINGRTSSSVAYSFQLFPKKTGVFTIGPAQMVVDNKTIESNKITIKVTKTQTLGSQKVKAQYFVKGGFSKSTIYVGEQVIYSFEFFSRVELAAAELKWPDFSAFWKEDIKTERKGRKIVNGLEWNWNRVEVALFPEATGKIAMPGTEIVAQVYVAQKKNSQSPFGNDPFFGRSSFFGRQRSVKRIRLRAKNQTLTVLPLPAKGQPANFSGLVGQFDLQSELSQKQMAVGDSVTLKIKLTGNGNMRDVRFPTFKVPKLKIYDDKPQLKIDHSKSPLTGHYALSRAIVPAEPGSLTLPIVQVHYFDPKDDSYKTLKTSEYTLNVSPGEALAQATPSLGGLKSSMKVLGQDIMPIDISERVLQQDHLSPLQKWIFGLVLLLLGGLYGLIRLMSISHFRRQGNSSYMKKSKAFGRFQNELTSLNESNDFYGEASRILRIYLGDKMDIEAPALTSDEIVPKLIASGVSKSTSQDIGHFILDCEKGQFGGGPPNPTQTQELLNQLKQLAQNMERGL